MGCWHVSPVLALVPFQSACTSSPKYCITDRLPVHNFVRHLEHESWVHDLTLHSEEDGPLIPQGIYLMQPCEDGH